MTATAAIIGGGVIGAGWAARFLLNGWTVRVHDPDPEAPRKVAEVLANARRALPMIYDTAMPAEGALTFEADLRTAVAGADWVQESAPERLDLKRRIYGQIAEAAPRTAILASSTSGFRPSEIFPGLPGSDRMIVAHPFNPVYLLPLVELVAVPGSDTIDRAADLLTGIGMFPLKVRTEIDAHIADRLLEAVWRESLWLVKDGIATTGEIDDAIRMGFGLRWAQMGLFETYRIAGGEAGMRHFLAQFGPALQWPWTKLTDVPDLTDDLVDKIAGQSDAQSGASTIRELERRRDDNLVSILRALKARDEGAGGVVRAHEAALRPAPVDRKPMLTGRRTVPVDWTDPNGHMNEGRYGQVFSDAAETVLDHLGAWEDYIATGFSFFTVETAISFKAETHAGEEIEVLTDVREAGGKKLRLWHEMRRASDGEILATCDQLLIHVSLSERRSAEPGPELAARMAALAESHRAGR